MRRACLLMVASIAAFGSAQTPPTHELSYGDNANQKIDLWLADSTEPTPLLLFIHGGGFRAGSYKQVNDQIVKLALDQGVSFASIEYRFTDQGPYPMQMNDCARALQFLRANAKKYNIDKSRVASFGGSAGACISMWLAFHDDMADPTSSDPVARESTRLIAAGSMNGQPTLDPETFKEWFGTKTLKIHPAIYYLFGVSDEKGLARPEVRKLISDASPITHLTKDDPPLFLSNGEGDVPVDGNTEPNVSVHHPRLGIKLKEAMDKIGIECHLQYRGGPSERQNVVQFLIEKLKAEETLAS